MKKLHIPTPTSGQLTQIKLAASALCFVGLYAGGVAAVGAQAQMTGAPRQDRHLQIERVGTLMKLENYSDGLNVKGRDSIESRPFRLL